MNDNIHSTGRGGAGNIGEDNRTYTDANIVREGVAGESNRSEYSAGRGGAGNMIPSPRDSPALQAQRGSTLGSEDVIPEPAMRSAEGYENFHTGRGGQGNIHKDKYGGHSSSREESRGRGEGIVEKMKHVVGMDKDKKDSESPLKQETGPE